MKKVFIIVGPESSGTRMGALLFQRAGIKEVGFDMGNAMEVFERESNIEIMNNNETLYVRRSIPHGRKPPYYLNFKEYHDGWVKHNFEPKWIVCIRGCYPLNKSKVLREKVEGIGESQNIIQEQYNYIFKGICNNNYPFFLLITSLLMVFPERGLKDLAFCTGIDFPLETIKQEIFDADGKWYEN